VVPSARVAFSVSLAERPSAVEQNAYDFAFIENDFFFEVGWREDDFDPEVLPLPLAAREGAFVLPLPTAAFSAGFFLVRLGTSRCIASLATVATAVPKIAPGVAAPPPWATSSRAALRALAVAIFVATVVTTPAMMRSRANGLFKS
jgi:hypothetical protein